MYYVYFNETKDKDYLKMPRICLVMKTRQQKERATACFTANSTTWWRGKWSRRDTFTFNHLGLNVTMVWLLSG